MTSGNVIKRRTLLVVSLVVSLLVGCGYCFVGISSRRPLDQLLFSSGLSSLDLATADLSKLCQRVGVHGRGRRSCARSSEIAGVLAEAAWVGVTHCQYLMKHDRWNCSLGHSRLKIMRNAFRETAFLQSMSAAAVTHVVSRACAAGKLSRCSCDDYSAEYTENLKVWRWGGCGDNIKYGGRFTRQIFTDGRKKNRKRGKNRFKQSVIKSPNTKPLRSRDLKAYIDSHNAQVGVKVVEKSTGQSCKCHGVSGSCAMRTCWKQLPSFITSADIIRSLYESSLLITTSNEAQFLPKGRRKKKMRPQRERRTESQNRPHIQLYNERVVIHAPSNRTRVQFTRRTDSKKMSTNRLRAYNSNDPATIHSKKANSWSSPKKLAGGLHWDTKHLVYRDRSPNFCRKSRYSPGTQSRRCEKGKNCESLCCGRGYDTTVAELIEPCKCNVVWCCKVQCLNCTRVAEIYTCK
ncbi:Protein Wnt-9b [Halocaridina rubra]|uniref:Protein Wnt n=1 Tax=Halocaridina rubra TaxID=373956 RepID=A0AAN8ZVH4_HALRR